MHATKDLIPSTMGKSPTQLAQKADCRGKRIGILIVAYNAVTTLVSVLKRIPPEVWENVEEVAVFDDASKDDTHALAVGYKMLTGINKLTVLRNEKNLGYGGNQKLGYQYFASKGFDVVVLLHGDGQYAPEILADLYAPLVRGEADAVFGSRMMKDYGGPRKGGMPLYKYVGNKILTFFENHSLKMRLTEFHSGYRAYSLDAIRKVDMTHMTDDFHYDTEIIIKLNHQGFRIHEVAIPTYYGDEICYVNGMKYAKDVYRAVVRYRNTLRGVRKANEFQEYFTHYPLKESRFSSHYFFRQRLGRNGDVLDIGCGEGFFARSVEDQRNRIVGVDILEEPSDREALSEYYSTDLDKGIQIGDLVGKRFDRILLQDILEHLRGPEKVLVQCRQYLKPNGLVLISVPNVANIVIRFSLLFGNWTYTERGILDRTHVRFFTRKSGREMLEQCGYEVVDTEATVIPIELIFSMPAKSLPMKIGNALLAGITRLLPGLFGYQCIYVARSRG